MLNPANTEAAEFFTSLGRFDDDKLSGKSEREVMLLSPRYEYAQQALMKGKTFPDTPSMVREMGRIKDLWGSLPRLELPCASLSEESWKDNS